MQYEISTEKLTLTSEQRAFAASHGLSERFLTLLLSRGLGLEQVEGFLHPSLDNLESPFAIGNMDKAVKRIKAAIENKEKILIYGDYDCDGICAVSILVLQLRKFANVSYFIPDREKHGYGISVNALDEVIEKYNPSLIISVDCGITAVGEAEYLRAKDIDLIVTDHHEPQGEIPNCIVVDPKIEKNCFFELCGAGVAFKLVYAMFGLETAKEYVDIAAIATLADVVPLKDDNRIIAHFGIEALKRRPRLGLKHLLGEDEVNSQNVMFRLAPRINSAGRIDSAMKVVDLFISDDYFLLKTLAEELVRNNAKRQQLCDEVLLSVKEKLKGKDFNDTGIIILNDDSWEAGILGIVAAKIAEEFNRPTILFSKIGDVYKGSARSIAKINIFEFLRNLNGYFTSFGGHSQAAGMSVRAEDFEEFKRTAEETMLKEYGLDSFLPVRRVDMFLPLDMDYLAFTNELSLLEPTGYGNPRPKFLIRGNGLNFDSIGYGSHMKCSLDNLDILGFFNFSESLYPTTGEAEFSVTLNQNVFRNRVTPQGILQSVSFKSINLSDADAQTLNVHQLSHEGGAYLKRVDLKFVENQLNSHKFGNLIVCFSKSDYENAAKLPSIKNLEVNIGNVPVLNPQNSVIVCPNKDFCYSYYNNVFIFGAPMCDGYLRYVYENSQNVYMSDGVETKQIKVSDEQLRDVYRILLRISASGGKLAGLHSLTRQKCDGIHIDEPLMSVALQIFSELKLVTVSEKGLLTVSQGKVNLSDSPTYRNLEHI